MMGRWVREISWDIERPAGPPRPAKALASEQQVHITVSNIVSAVGLHHHVKADFLESRSYFLIAFLLPALPLEVGR